MTRLALLAVCAAALVARADDKPSADAARFAELRARYAADEKAALAPGAEAVSFAKYVPQFMELGRCDDEATALQARTFAADRWIAHEEGGAASEAILTRFAASPRLADFLRPELNTVRTTGDGELLCCAPGEPGTSVPGYSLRFGARPRLRGETGH